MNHSNQSLRQYNPRHCLRSAHVSFCLLVCSYDESQAIQKLLISQHSDGSSHGGLDDHQVDSTADIMHHTDGGRDLEWFADQSQGAVEEEQVCVGDYDLPVDSRSNCCIGSGVSCVSLCYLGVSIDHNLWFTDNAGFQLCAVSCNSNATMSPHTTSMFSSHSPAVPASRVS